MAALDYRHTLRWMTCCLTVALSACTTLPAPQRSGTSYTAPIVEANGMMYVEARINGQGPYLLLFDTGAELTIDAKWAGPLGLPSGKAVRVVGPSIGDGMGTLSRADSVVLAGLTLPDLAAVIYTFKPDAVLRPIGGVPVVGFIGGDLLRRYPVTMDQRQMQLTLHDDDKSLFANDELTWPMIRDVTGPVIAIDVAGKQTNMLLDSGANASIAYLAGDAIFDNPATAPYTMYGGRPFRVGRSVEMSTPFSDAKHYVVHASDDPVFRSNYGISGQFTPLDGWVGNACFRGRVVKLDWQAGLVSFGPGVSPACTNPFGATGARAVKEPAGFRVVEVLSGSPARRANFWDNADPELATLISVVDGKQAGTLTQQQFDMLNATDAPTLSVDVGGRTVVLDKLRGPMPD